MVTPEFAGTTLQVLADAVVRSLLVAGLAAALLAVVRPRRAQVTVHVWTLVLYAGLAMPVLVWMLPSFSVPMPTFAAWLSSPWPPGTRWLSLGTLSAGAVPAAAAPPLSMTWSAIAFGVYAFGAVWLLARAAAAWRAARRLQLSAATIDDATLVDPVTRIARGFELRRAPALLESADVDVPVTCGVHRPSVILPLSWRSWPRETLDAVLLHEIAHVARRDALTQGLALVHRAVCWINPFAWWLRRRLADLAEQASDDAALAGGVEPARYAGILLQFFVAVQTRSRREDWQLAMARGAGAERRVQRVLEWKGDRPMSKKLVVRGLLIAAVPIVVLAAAIRPALVAASSMPLPEKITVEAQPPADSGFPPAVTSSSPVVKEQQLPPPPPPPPPHRRRRADSCLRHHLHHHHHRRRRSDSCLRRRLRPRRHRRPM